MIAELASDIFRKFCDKLTAISMLLDDPVHFAILIRSSGDLRLISNLEGAELLDEMASIEQLARERVAETTAPGRAN